MTTLTLTVRFSDLSFQPHSDRGGEDAVLTFFTPVTLPTVKEALRDMRLGNAEFVLELRRKAEHEQDANKLGVVNSFRDDRFTFLVRTDSRHGAPPRGAFVITESGVIGVIVSVQADDTELFRALVRDDALTPERIDAETPLLQYTCLMLGGLGVTPTGSFAYYHLPLYPLRFGENVLNSPPRKFFALGTEQEPAMIRRFGQVLVTASRTDPAIAAMMIRNAATADKGDVNVYMQALTGDIEDDDVQDAILSACETMFQREIL